MIYQSAYRCFNGWCQRDPRRDNLGQLGFGIIMCAYLCAWFYKWLRLQP